MQLAGLSKDGVQRQKHQDVPQSLPAVVAAAPGVIATVAAITVWVPVVGVPIVVPVGTSTTWPNLGMSLKNSVPGL